MISNNYDIPFFPYSKLYELDKKNFDNIFQDVCGRGAYILQRDLDEFENELKEFLSVKHVFGVANGTDALILGLKAMDLQEEDEVIMPSHTYIASPASVHLCGGKPVLAECADDGMLDVSDIEHRITPNTRAIMPVHINGRTCNMDKIKSLAEKHNLSIVEDAAQGLGSKFKGQCAGTFGTFGTISFYPAKLLGCFGDGGLIMTNDDSIAEKLFLLRDHGRNEEGKVVAWGYNSRLDNLQAAILSHKLKTYPKDIEHRRKIATIYDQELNDISELKLPEPPDIDDNFDVYQNYEFRASNRDGLRNFLSEKGIGTIIQWAGTPVHKFKELGFKQNLPKTDEFFRECLMLPMNSALTEQEASYVASSVREFYGK